MDQEQAERQVQRTLQALGQESACLQALVEAGYQVDEAARWIETWVGEDADCFWGAGAPPEV